MRRFGLTTLTALALAAAPAVGQQYRELLKNDPLLEALTLPRMVNLSDLLKSPEAYRGLNVRVTIAFCDLGKLENPFFTRFTNNNYMNFAAWDDTQPIWRKEEYLKSYPLLFARRTTPICDQFADAKRFDRFLVEVVVQDTFRGKPWVEIVSARKEEAALSMGSLRHLYHASTQAERGNYSIAQGEVQRALQSPLPNHHRIEALSLSARIQEKLGDKAGALATWEQVLGLEPESKEARKERDRLALEEHQEQPAPAPAPTEGATEVVPVQETPEFLEPPKTETPAGETPPSEVGKDGTAEGAAKQGEAKIAETPVPAGGATPPAGSNGAPVGQG
ncbi:MAG: hypothetical protein IPN34_05235 [Planctomycetes bacterium]|nr:hypothetical protein [Planctomycetota bacterium]